LNNKRWPSLLLKVDIAKAFDSVAWPYLLQVLEHVGFPQRWRNWISILLSTASTKVMLNGRPGRRIAHARGPRQGDPLSPMLFVIAMEPLNALIRKAGRSRVLTPLPGRCIRHRASLYADDLIVLVAPVLEDLNCIQQILSLLAGASGLVANLDKCVLTPIQCTDELIVAAQEAFPGAVVPFSCTYVRTLECPCHSGSYVG
jgi:hypothetical protein